MPTIIDLFTAGASGSRQTVFSRGDPLQFNVVHTLSEDLPLRVRYRATWIIERYEQALAFEEVEDFELLFEVRRMFSFDSSYRFRTMRTFFDFTLPAAAPPPFPVRGSRQDVLRFLTDDMNLALAVAGLWKVTVNVELTETHTGRPFSVLSDWHYRVLP
jgi:hypothetical protein